MKLTLLIQRFNAENMLKLLFCAPLEVMPPPAARPPQILFVL